MSSQRHMAVTPFLLSSSSSCLSSCPVEMVISHLLRFHSFLMWCTPHCFHTVAVCWSFAVSEVEAGQKRVSAQSQNGTSWSSRGAIGHEDRTLAPTLGQLGGQQQVLRSGSHPRRNSCSVGSGADDCRSPTEWLGESWLATWSDAWSRRPWPSNS